MDQAVKNAQEWLNETYTGEKGYTPISEDGIIGAGTIKALIIALQIEEGDTNPDGIFGKNTSSNCPELSEGYIDVTHHFCRLLQHALYCKGYSPTAVTGIFGPNTASAVKQIQKNVGIEQTGIVNGKLMKQILSLDSLVNKGDEKIREIQQNLNGKYLDYFDIIPTDGLPSKQLAKGLIYALQAEEGLDTSTANGNFGPTTQAKCPVLSEGDTRQNFVKILKYALYINGQNLATFNGTYDSDTTSFVTSFQRFACLPVEQYGTADLTTWASLLTSKGNENRPTSACDTSKTLTTERLQTLINHGYRIFGRYLTGKYAMTRDEIDRVFALNADIDNPNYRIFPIFQRTGGSIASNKIEYFTEAQGLVDGKEAAEAAFNLGFKNGTIIFFASDVDAYDYQVKQILLPYYKKVNEAFHKNKKRKYSMGLYGPRNTCIQVIDAHYASAAFVSDMSTGYSGNLGYPLPGLWAFDQYAGTSFGTSGSSNYIDIDKVAVSGYYNGETEVKYPDPLDPYENEKLAKAIEIAIPITVQFETGYSGENVQKAYSRVTGNFDGAGISFGIIQYNFGQDTLQPILNEMIVSEPDTMSEIFGNNYEKLKEKLYGEKEDLLKWATEISTPDKTTLISPWKEYFEKLGENNTCQNIQKNHLDTYWKRAIDPICKNYGLKTYRGFAVAFDIAVNSWSLGDEAYNEIMSQVTDSTPEKDILQLMANYGTEDGKSRRQAIVNGFGTVHGVTLNLDTDFGLNDDSFR